MELQFASLKIFNFFNIENELKMLDLFFKNIIQYSQIIPLIFTLILKEIFYVHSLAKK